MRAFLNRRATTILLSILYFTFGVFDVILTSLTLMNVITWPQVFLLWNCDPLINGSNTWDSWWTGTTRPVNYHFYLPVVLGTIKTLSVLVSSITPSYVTIGIISSRGRNCFIWDDFFATVRGGSCSLISFVPLSEIWLDLFLLFVFEWRVWPLGREGTLSSSELLL